ncbi:MarR family winged helix-turn-helix transcriptional regulator [Streptomyces sp. NBC_00247]|uniref:MarR family winged helix-turn-helix transcriptional regulator n=1 Tax=Streptomyces sp. NBC_00247 TaxID=2975689 RepID=UPI002E2E292C|nr:MarR family winged helix-turn-helix transcriptional regulator [Streptomyces sp. NBC_00247]
MDEDLAPEGVAAALLASIGVLVRRVRHVPVDGGLAMPERAALALLDRSGPTTSSALAREAQITAQAMGATLAALRARGLVERRPDPEDGRRAVLTMTAAGHKALEDKRNARTDLLTRALTGGAFTPAELDRLAAVAPLLDRLARTVRPAGSGTPEPGTPDSDRSGTPDTARTGPGDRPTRTGETPQ